MATRSTPIVAALAAIATLSSWITGSSSVSGAPVERPLYLTPYIEAGDIATALSLSRVRDPCDLSDRKEDCGAEIPESYAGFLTVNETLKNHLFFWFFPSQEYAYAPVLIWLNGGPGISSMMGLFWANGPLQPRALSLEIVGSDSANKFEARNGSWVGPFSMLYIDSPVGTGYSHTSSGPRTTPEEYGQDLYEAVVQFYKLFPHLLSTDLYIGGQSYAGKYVPVLAHRIHEEKQSNIPLRGIYIGGPLFAPEVQFPANFEYMYAVGIISEYTRAMWKKATQDIVDKHLSGEVNSSSAIEQIMPLIFGPQIPSYDNYVSGKDAGYDIVTDIMRSARIRKAAHVGSLAYVSSSDEIFQQLIPDIMTSTNDKLADLLDAGRYRILIFSGDYDIIVSVAMVEAGLMATPWRGQEQYKSQTRDMWYGPMSEEGEQGPLYGYYSRTGRLCRVIIHGAGHQVPHDKPDASREMMLQFVKNGCVQ